MRTLLGVILAVTPAALWISWTTSMLVAVLALALISAVALTWLTPDGEPGTEGKVELPPQFVDEVQRLFPLTYHHSFAGPARFRLAMRRLSQELLKSR